MPLPIRFPREGDRIHEDALAYRRLTPTERLLAILDLIASGISLMEQSARPEIARQLQLAQEEEWRRIFKELLARHASRAA